MYAVKEIFSTLQGEGANAGRAAVFVRFAGCNLWTGREQHRAEAVCQFCDTDFVGTDGTSGGFYETPEALTDAVDAAAGTSPAFVVLTGGEPLLQVDRPLTGALHAAGYGIAVETNGTVPLDGDVDWLCVSPKARAILQITEGDELKLVFPQEGAPPERYAAYRFGRFYLSPMDGPDLAENTALAVDYCLAHPQWRLSIQTHKVIGVR